MGQQEKRPPTSINDDYVTFECFIQLFLSAQPTLVAHEMLSIILMIPELKKKTLQNASIGLNLKTSA